MRPPLLWRLSTTSNVFCFSNVSSLVEHNTRLKILLALVLTTVHAQRIVLTNDDGWATASVRAQYNSLKAAGFDVILSCPAVNKSGTGSSSSPPTTLTSPCQFNTCPRGSPAEGADASDSHINYVNSFPVDSVRFGIQTLAPRLFGTQTDFVVSGPNIGTNLGTGITGSGTVGAASEASLEGIPSVAFSGSSGSSVIFTTLTSDPNSTASLAARVYADLSTTLTLKLISSGSPFLPRGVSPNVNYSPVTNCRTASAFEFIFTRIASTTASNDTRVCGSNHLTDESTIIRRSGCFATVSVFNATTKRDVDAATQAVVVQKLGTLLSCPQ